MTGPTWFYGTSVEHSVLYQLTLSGAEDIFITHVQTETPYFQPNPDASQPFDVGFWDSDPDFSDCVSGSNCEDAWAFRVLDSSDILVYTAGFYSFFNAFEQTCLNDESCQERLVETSFTQGFWLYNIFTIGAAEVVSPMGGIPPTLQSDDNQKQAFLHLIVKCFLTFVSHFPVAIPPKSVLGLFLPRMVVISAFHLESMEIPSLYTSVTWFGLNPAPFSSAPLHALWCFPRRQYPRPLPSISAPFLHRSISGELSSL